ncbi:hypothetical protein RNZ50_10160 [Paracoccaceae bacterium Fryx2]|nr:hypothetical protein [Paracoccaceae bacterium Fryx2]
MRIVYHLGAHCTDEERLLRCLLKNRGALAAEGIVVPGPARYRTLLRDTAVTLKGMTATQDTQALVLDQIMDEDVAERLILSWDSFLAFPQGVLRRTLYPAAAERMRSFTQIFPQIEAEFFLAIRSPATFLPALFAKQRGKSYAEFTEEADLATLRWSDLIAEIRHANPDVPLTVWCDEDTPLIWPEVLRAVSGHSPGLRLEEDDDLLAAIMSPDGFRRMNAYLEGHPPANEMQRRRVVSAFLDKFALPEQIEMELEMPGWTEELVAALTLTYDRDVALIARRPDVTFLAP